QLLQYKKFKEAAGQLGQMSLDAQNQHGRSASAFAPASERPLKHVDRIDLWNSFNLVLRRLAEKLVVGEIHAEQVTVADQMEYVLGQLQTRKAFVFSALFPEKISLRRLVATFLAVLELTRLKKLQLQQTEAFTDILCTAVEEIPLETPAVPNTVPVSDEADSPPPQS
ncbi:MAG TPA: segregation/condensation protein A, partial [Lacunisphaera sp.]|nr:segregation/condensation protein A [Lacunisphaera sp.]